MADEENRLRPTMWSGVCHRDTVVCDAVKKVLIEDVGGIAYLGLASAAALSINQYVTRDRRLYPPIISSSIEIAAEQAKYL